MIQIKEFFDKATSTLTYVVWDPTTFDAVIIDPVLDYDQAASKVGEESVSAVASFADKNRLNVHYILDLFHDLLRHLSQDPFPELRYGRKMYSTMRTASLACIFLPCLALVKAFEKS